MIHRFALAIYALVLRTIGFAERRCAYCKKLMGYKYGPAFRRFRKDPLLRSLPFLQTHGICEPCKAIYFPEPTQSSVDAGITALADFFHKPPRRQHQSRKNLRRTLGGWSGAAAV